jgi:hypothetical protein
MELCENSNINTFIDNLKQLDIPLPEDVLLFFCFILFFFLIKADMVNIKPMFIRIVDPERFQHHSP